MRHVPVARYCYLFQGSSSPAVPTRREGGGRYKLPGPGSPEDGPGPGSPEDGPGPEYVIHVLVLGSIRCN